MLNRIAEFSGRIVIISGVIFAISVVAYILDLGLGTFVLVRYAMSVMIGSLIVGGAAAIVRFALSTFGSAQIRLQELIATFFAGATAASIAAAWVKSAETDPDEQARMIMQYTAASLALFFTGSAWSWTAARRLREESPRARFKLMLIGWVVCAGGMALTLCLSALLAVSFARPAAPWLFVLLYVSAPLSLLVIPGFVLERRCRQAQHRSAESAAPATESPHADGETSAVS